MRVALVPMRVNSADPEANPRALAKWVEHLHAKTDLIVFPQIEVARFAGTPRPRLPESASLLHLQGDLIGGFAARRNVWIAAGFWETRGAETCGMLVLADRTGQLEMRTRKLAAESEEEHFLLPLLTARVRNLPSGVAMPDDLFEESLIRAANLFSIKLLMLPIYQAAPQSKFKDGDVLPTDLVRILDRAREVALKTRAHVLVVNALADEEDPDLGPCGGAWVCDPQGNLAAAREMYDETPLEYEIG